MTLYRDTEDIVAASSAAGPSLRLSGQVVLKDYWVTETLRTLTKDHGDSFVFKGGTSLSKGYGIIERFSEDVDLLITTNLSRSAAEKLMKVMTNCCQSGLGCKVTVEDARNGVSRSVLIHYPGAEEVQFPRPQIKLDIGVLGGSVPHESREIRPLIASAVAALRSIDGLEDLTPFSLSLLHPGRTLVEKLSLLHTSVSRVASGEAKFDDEHARHYYDIHQLLRSDRARELLADHAAYLELVNEVERVTREIFAKPMVQRPSDGYAASVAFQTARLPAGVSTAYDSVMSNYYYGSGRFPLFDDVLETVRLASGIL